MSFVVKVKCVFWRRINLQSTPVQPKRDFIRTDCTIYTLLRCHSQWQCAAAATVTATAGAPLSKDPPIESPLTVCIEAY